MYHMLIDIIVIGIILNNWLFVLFILMTSCTVGECCCCNKQWNHVGTRNLLVIDWRQGTVLLWLQRGNWTHYKGATHKRYPQNSYKGGIFLHTYWYKLQRGNFRSMVRYKWIFVSVTLPLTLAHLTYPLPSIHSYTIEKVASI
jgi:hypothetical protein